MIDTENAVMICDECGEAITDKYYYDWEMQGKHICRDCLMEIINQQLDENTKEMCFSIDVGNVQREIDIARQDEEMR